MLSTTLSFANLHAHGKLFAEILRARSDAASDPYSWDMPQAASQVVYDQYDTPVSRWIAVHDDTGRVLAGARLTPTTAQAGVYSYMIRDAQAGLIDHVPDMLLDQPAPVDAAVWEMTRGFVAVGLTDAMREAAHNHLLSQIMLTARQEKIRQLIGILPDTWAGWADRHGLTCRPAGPLVSLDGRCYQAVWVDMDTTVH